VPLMTRDKLAEALRTHGPEIREADEWRPLAQHVLDLLAAAEAKADGYRNDWKKAEAERDDAREKVVHAVYQRDKARDQMEAFATIAEAEIEQLKKEREQHKQMILTQGQTIHEQEALLARRPHLKRFSGLSTEAITAEPCLEPYYCAGRGGACADRI
jgi:hypothetical protein